MTRYDCGGNEQSPIDMSQLGNKKCNDVKGAGTASRDKHIVAQDSCPCKVRYFNSGIDQRPPPFVGPLTPERPWGPKLTLDVHIRKRRDVFQECETRPPLLKTQPCSFAILCNVENFILYRKLCRRFVVIWLCQVFVACSFLAVSFLLPAVLDRHVVMFIVVFYGKSLNPFTLRRPNLFGGQFPLSWVIVHMVRCRVF